MKPVVFFSSCDKVFGYSKEWLAVVNSLNGRNLLRLFFGDFEHDVIDLLDDWVDFFHDFVIERVHQFVDSLITIVVHFNLLRVPLNFHKQVPTNVRITVSHVIVDHVHHFNVFTNLFKFLIEILFYYWNYVLKVCADNLLVWWDWDSCCVALCL